VSALPEFFHNKHIFRYPKNPKCRRGVYLCQTGQGPMGLAGRGRQGVQFLLGRADVMTYISQKQILVGDRR
jgi:hypothetical protein